MLRRTKVIVLAICLAGCGSFLGLSGDDEEDEKPPASAVDGSADGTGTGDEGGAIVPGIDAASDAPPGKTDGSIANDAAVDAKTDADAGSDGSVNPAFRYVFVTSAEYPGNFLLGGGNADQLCKDRAEAGVPALMGKTWRAWISTPLENADDNLGVESSIPYFLPSNAKVADNYADLVNGSLDHAIDRNELNAEVNGASVWTGSSAAGEVLTNNHCNSWTAVAQAVTGRVGSTSSATTTWSDNADLGCLSMARLYCFEL